MRVIVVGAGIGGLSAAIGLRRAGHDVVVLERAPRIEAVGAGITLFANAMDALARLGVRDAVAAQGAPAKRSAIFTREGDRLSELPADLLEGTCAVHRANLQAVLADAAGEVHLGVEVTAVEQDGDSVVARGADGSEERADLLVGADGIHSRVRASFIDTPVRYAGYVAWRGIAPVTIEAGNFTESWGAGERFGLVDVGRGRTYWFATKNAAEGESDEPAGRKAELVRRFGGWHAPIPEVIEASDNGAILRNDVYYLKSPGIWSNRRVVLLGDAAHATTPGVGQGAAMAIEDAVVLSDSLPLDGDPAGTLAEYEAIRRPRAESVLKMSRRADRAAQLSNPLGRGLRNVAVRLMPAGAQRRQLETLIRHKL